MVRYFARMAVRCGQMDHGTMDDLARRGEVRGSCEIDDDDGYRKMR